MISWTRLLSTNKVPNISHSNFKLWAQGRQYVFLVGILSNRMWEKYDIKNDEWTVIPSLPKDSIYSDVFCINNQYLWWVITPYELELSKMKFTLYSLDLTWEDETSWEERPSLKPVDYNAKFPFSMEFPAKIVDYPYYYFVDVTGSHMIKTKFNPFSCIFVSVENYTYKDPGKSFFSLVLFLTF